jgi:serine protease AprX
MQQHHHPDSPHHSLRYRSPLNASNKALFDTGATGRDACPTKPRSSNPTPIPLLRRFRQVRLLLAASLLAGLHHSTKADCLQQKADRFLLQKAAARPVAGWSGVLVRLHGKLTPQQKAQLKTSGAYVYRHLPLIESLAIRVPNRHLSRLAALPFVKRLSYDAPLQKCDEFTVGASGADIAFSQYQLTGSEIGVAVLDSGVNSHTDLNKLGHNRVSRMAANISFVQGDRSTSDSCGHGTHVAGIIAGNGSGSTGAGYFRTFYGIARNANIINVRVLDTYGRGTVSSMVSAIAWCISNKRRCNIRVMNLSLGHPVGESYTTDPLCQAVEQAWRAGIVVVCAAGNGGRLNTTQSTTPDNEGWGTAYGSINSPANDPYVITVGAMKSYDGFRLHDRITTYSSRGPTRLDFILKPDIVAPGNRVVSLNAPSTYLPNTYGLTNLVTWNEFCSVYKSADTSKYFRLAGTSMAAPVVSGAVALMLQKDPNLTPDTVKARLMFSADKWNFPDDTTDPCAFGAGYLNIPAALNSTVVATQYAFSPRLNQDSSGNVSFNLNSIWGTKAIWGTGVSDLKAIWGTSAIWGTNMLCSGQTIWSSGVFTDTQAWSIDGGAVDLSSRTIYGE